MELYLIATIAPSLPLASCSKPGIFEALASSLASQGYWGLEVQVSQLLLIGKRRFLATIRQHKLKWIGKVYSSGGPTAVPSLGVAQFGACKSEQAENEFETERTTDIVHPMPGSTVEDHLRVWEASVRECVSDIELKELLVSISSQSGRDVFHRGGGVEADVFFTRALEVEAEVNVPIHHETHRHRLLFSPFLSVDVVKRHAALKILADLSHYSVVCEAPCGDPELEGAISVLIPNVHHIHARVGFEEGPQILDPRMPKYQLQLEGHAAWWRAIFVAAKRRGAPYITVTPEFLPPPYCWVDTNDVPLVDFNDVNAFMATYVKDLFKQTFADN